MKKMLLFFALLLSPVLAFSHGNGHHDDDHTGPQGPKGDKGDKGNNGTNGKNGVDGVNGTDGKDGLDNSKLDDAIHDVNRTKVIGEGVIRLYDAKRFQINAFANYDFRGRKAHEIGARIEYKLGRSYEERRIEALEKLLERHLSYLERKYKSRELLPEGK